MIRGNPNGGYYNRKTVWTNFYYLLGMITLMLALQFGIQVYNLFFTDQGILSAINLVAEFLPYGIWLTFVWTMVVFLVSLMKTLAGGLRREPY